MDLAFAGRLAVVTGADSGIGLHTAVALATEGAKVLMSDMYEDLLGDALAQAKQAVPDAEVYSVTADLSNLSEVEGLLKAADDHGGAAVLAHLAGTRGAAGDFLELSDEGWLETLNTDLMSAVRLCRTFIPGMRARGYGRIVLTASENAVQPYTQETPYNAAKAAIVNLTKGLSKAYGKDGVTRERRLARLRQNAHDRRDDGAARTRDGCERRRGRPELFSRRAPRYYPRTPR